MTLDLPPAQDLPAAAAAPAVAALLPRPELAGRRILVVGLGESGLAMARWASFGGAEVTVVDTRAQPPQHQTLFEQCPQARFFGGALEPESIDRLMPEGVDLVAWSQGLSPTQGPAAAFHQALQARGIEVWGELDFFAVEIARLRQAGHDCKVLAITGTNGKTTTTQLVAHLCHGAGLRTCAMALQIKASNVAQAITKFYADHPEAHRATPFIAFNGYIERGACSPFVNKARQELGLPPMKPTPLPKPAQQ